MITKAVVNGFRSLNNFEIVLHPGLNILVGPNGSGKTNIIAFFEFLSNIVAYGTSDTINLLGGAGSVFSKCSGPSDEFQHKVEATVFGCAQIQSSKYLNYKYHFVIDSSNDFNKIVFSLQDISVSYSNEYSQQYHESLSAFRIVKKLNEKKTEYEIQNFDKKYVDSPFFSMITKENKKKKNEDTLESFFADFVEDEMSIVVAMNYILNDAGAITSDLRSGQVFNFIPSQIKKPEETSSKIGIQKDGSGLAATLYAIETRQGIEDKQQRSISRYLVRARRMDSEIINVKLSDVIKYIKIANPSIEKISVHNDRFENLLKIKFSIKKDNESIVLPISSMSDGTIKWISFVTSILTSPTVFSIEEPENYLHPLMQSEVIKLMRNASERKNRKSTIMMSTHSETILNSASPEEIIIIEFKNGSTTAKRCTNAAEISEEIKNTGFGLGYYYISGSIEHE
jgi:predicted ATPase